MLCCDWFWDEKKIGIPIIRLYASAERPKQMEQILNFQVPAEGLELVILLHNSTKLWGIKN